MKTRIIRELLVGVVVSATLPGMAFGGAADMKTTDGNSMKFEYEGSSLRINTGQEGSYMILNDKGMYVVNESGGRLTVIDAGQMLGMFGDMDATAPSVAGSEVVSLEATGQHEVYAGITGEIYNLEYFDEDAGQVQTTQLVLSTDPRAIQLTRAITGMASSMTKAAGKSGKGVNELQQHMSKLNKGVLRYGNDMWVTAISDRTIASERFVLPAKPKDLSGMAGMTEIFSQTGSSQASSSSSDSGLTEQSAEQPKKKGLVSGFLSSFSKKADDQAERQQNRAEDKVDDAVDDVVDDATDKAVDSVLDKALGKIFGN